MGLYKLLVGVHHGPDYTKEPVKFTDAVGNVVERYPPRTYRAGETVESDTDLVAFGGPGKFSYVGEGGRRKVSKSAKPGDVTPEAALRPVAVAPGGQVAEGFQQTTTGPDGRPVSGPAGPEAWERGLVGPQAGERGGAADEGDDLHAMTVKDLHSLAEAEEIDLQGATRKEDIIRAVRRARGR